MREDLNKEQYQEHEHDQYIDKKRVRNSDRNDDLDQQISSDYKPDWVSVIIPSHNRAGMIIDTLTSVLKQQYRPIEVIVIDDDSSDSTQAIVQSFAATCEDETFKVRLHFAKHRNASLCRNDGLNLSCGEFIQFLDSDDIIHPQKLTQQVAALKQTQHDFVWSSTVKFCGEPDWTAPGYVGAAHSYGSPVEAIVAFINKSQWRTESGLLTRHACIRTGYWSGISMFQDWEYHIRLLAWQPRISHVPGNYSGAHQHDQGRIGDKWSNGSGLDGALTALKNATKETFPLCFNEPSWRTSVLNRANEIARQAEKTNYPDVVQRANQFILAFENEVLKG